MTNISFTSNLILLQNYIYAFIWILEEKRDLHLLYLVSKRKQKQICIYFKRIIRKPSDAILCVVHDRCVAICTIGRHYKKYTIEIRSIGMRRDAFNSFLSRHGSKGTRCWNIILHGNLCSRAEMKNISIVCFFSDNGYVSKFSSPRITMCDWRYCNTRYFHTYMNTDKF